MTISIPLKTIRWSGGNTPSALERHGNHGFTQISIIRNHDTGTVSGSEMITSF
jgi:hypothetical protein